MTEESQIDYAKLIDSAMHYVVKKVLDEVNANGLPGEHHFFITFKTEAPGVMIDDVLKEKYPDEMTIVLQHQYQDLEITDEYFSVVLSFDHVKHNLTVPFNSLISFVDPSVKFGLQFNSAYSEDDLSEGELEELLREEGLKGDLPQDVDGPKAANVVTLDAFRKDK